MSKLALFGGSPSITSSFKSYNSIGDREKEKVNKVLDKGVLSGFYGSWCEQFHGGEMVREFEKKWASKFNVKHALSVNSATSGLLAAIGATKINPGDEVILPAYTMSATAVAPLFYGGIPVFADVEAKTFCLDVKSVRNLISERTKAIIAVNLFGHPAELYKLKKLAKKYNLILIEDNSQAPLASEDNTFAGTIGDIGIFSLNCHKHIQSGEGGVVVTNNDELAQSISLIRNHGENVVKDIEVENIINTVGLNLRMTEVGAAIANAQLDNIDEHINRRIECVNKLNYGIKDIPGIVIPEVRSGCDHVYYTWTLKVDENQLGIDRNLFSKALTAEGVPHGVGYIEPLYNLPIFKNKIAFGNNGYPFNLSDINYHEGLCPVTEKLYKDEVLVFENCAYDLTDVELNNIVNAFHKIVENKDAFY